jgi:hypothetical protein
MVMLYITRSRQKESMPAEQLSELNHLIDNEIIPAVREIQGVRAAQAYNSIGGELVMLLDIENMATVDRIISNRAIAPAFSKLTSYVVRTGGEVLYDRPAWQGLYGKS